MGISHDNPFPGLRPFETDEAHLFFGRDGQAVELLRLLRQHRFVAVVGPSGSGKSSLVRAGLLPGLHGGIMRSAGSCWRVAVLRPGANPIGNLARALSSLEVLGNEKLEERDRREFMEITLRRGSLGLAEAVAEARLPEGENLLVVVDQFEEIFRFLRVSTQTGTRDDAAAFVKLLLAGGGAEGVPCYVLLTMRSDYLGDCAQFRDLPEAINRGQYLIPRMTRDERRSAIIGPVAVGEGEIAPRLVSRILNDVGDEPDQLPILQHALMRAWDEWKEGVGRDEPLDLRHYEAVGGAQEALSRHAEEAYAELDASGRELTEKVFRQLTERGPDNRDIRRPTRFGELCAVVDADSGEVAAVVDVFRRPGRSFLMPPADLPLESGTLVDISHESLIRGWKRLRDWVEEEAEAARRYRRLAETALLWKAGRASLLLDPELSDMVEWWDRDRPASAWGQAYHPGFAAAAEFLEQSRNEREREQERQRNRAAAKRRLRRITIGALAAGLIFTSTLSAVALKARARALDAEEKAVAARDSAKTARADAETKRAAAETALREAERARREANTARGSLNDALIATAAEARRADYAAEQAKEARNVALLRLDRATSSERQTLRDRQQRLNELRAVLTNAREDAGVRNMPSLLGQEGWTLSNLGLHRKAEQSYSRALLFNGKNTDVLVNRSDTYLNLDKPDSARRDLEIVLRLEPNNFLARLNMAVAQLMSRHYAVAAQGFQRALEATRYGVTEGGQPMVSPEIQRATAQRTLTLDRHEVPTALRLALVSTQAFDPRGFPSFIDSLRTIDQGEDWSMNAVLNALNWLWLTRKRQEWHEVGDYVQFAIEGGLWERAGWSKEMMGKGEFALEAARSYCRFQVLHRQRADPRYEWLARSIPSRLARLGYSRCAALQLDPPQFAPDSVGVEDLLIQARSLEIRDSLRAAEILYTVALSRVTVAERPYILLDRGRTRLSIGDQSGDSATQRRYFRAAAADADSALMLRPRLAEAYFARGRARFDAAAISRDLGNPRDRAAILADMDTALAYQPTMTYAHVIRAVILQGSSGEGGASLREAAASWRAAHRLSPENPWIATNLALIELRRGEYAAAEAAANNAIRLAPDSLRSYEIAEAAALRFPTDSLQSATISRRVAGKFLQLGEASQVLGEPLRAEYFYLASLREYAEAAVAGTERLDRELLEAGRRYRCVYLRGASDDPRRNLRDTDPIEAVQWSSRPALQKAGDALEEVDRTFDRRTSCAAPSVAGGRRGK